MTDYFVGLMSGTSMDGIDAVLVSFGENSVRIHASSTQPYPDELRAALLDEIRKPLDVTVDPDGFLDRAVGESFHQAAATVISKSGIDSARIVAIGSHGQTLRHQPNAQPPFTIQIGNPGSIAAATGVPVVGNFRAADIAAGGQGAPLVPPFHEWLFHSADENRAVVNIGGIANVTVLPMAGEVTGFDTGPGNGLMDSWVRRHDRGLFDDAGSWGASGRVSADLLQQMLADPYFAQQPPKSTGFEYFNAEWLDAFDIAGYAPQDVQATLCELTARSIAGALQEHAPGAAKLFVCGGGAHNVALMRRLDRNLPDTDVAPTSAAGLHPDWVEACAFAWLARATQNGQPGNLPSVTGANKSVVLGEIHSP